jgi:hypothetical protein
MPITSAFLDATVNFSQQANALGTEILSHAQKPWKIGKLISTKRDKFAATFLPPVIQAALRTTFGKDSILHSSCAEKAFHYVLLPVLKSGFLPLAACYQSPRKKSRQVRMLQMIRKKYRSVNFLPLQGFQSNWEETTTIREDWKVMTTACLLHIDGDVARMVVQWIGGPHPNNAHLNVPKILSTLQEPVIESSIFEDVKRILTLGAPAYCNAEASEANFQEFLNYGNHESVTPQNQSVSESMFVKQSKKRRLTLIMDAAMIHFALNAHLTPQGLVDIMHPRRKPRPISDLPQRRS